MGLEQLVQRLERETDARIADIDGRARDALDAIAREQERASGEARDRELARRRDERRRRLDRDLAEARARANARVLAARGAFCDRVLARAEALLDAADRDEAYLGAVVAQTREALRFVEDRAVTVRCRPAIAERLALDSVGRDQRVSIESDPACPAGVRIAATDGTVSIDDTLRARLERLASGLRPILVAEIER